MLFDFVKKIIQNFWLKKEVKSEKQIKGVWIKIKLIVKTKKRRLEINGEILKIIKYKTKDNILKILNL